MKEKYYLGIELGSTRIKSVLIDDETKVVCQGSYEWQNELNGGYWSYPLTEVEKGLQASYRELADSFKRIKGSSLTEVSAMGVSAMMHGYLAFDENDDLLVPFRTWRNTNTLVAAAELTELFDFNIPMRWSVAHYYQAILNKEEHVYRVTHITTLAGYVHYLLTGNKVLGIGDASGMFPVRGKMYDPVMMEKFDILLKNQGISVSFSELLPTPLFAGENAGYLTESGARLLDSYGELKPGCPLCPPEGDAGTGMVATNSISPKTANVSAGTSAFLMVVLDKKLSSCHREIDMVSTPSGAPVAMIHTNNFASEITAWCNLFEESVNMCGVRADRGELFNLLYSKSAESDKNLGGMLVYNLVSGEPVVGVEKGTPIIMRASSGRLTLGNLMKTLIYSALAPLALGYEILKSESVEIDRVCGHGGFFKTPAIGQRAMSAALDAPVTVLDNAGEGGAWGIALLAMFSMSSKSSLEDFLNELFVHMPKSTLSANENETTEFKEFLKKYEKGLDFERAASEVL